MCDSKGTVQRVIVYSTVNCSNCARLKAVLKNLGIKYDEMVLEENDVAELILKYDIYSVPALVVGNMVFEFRGYEELR